MDKSQFLQAMRFVAAALVLCAHVTFYYHERVDRSIAVWGAGAVGVPIFFVISGIVMVVASQSLPVGALGAREFLLRRIIRIVPLWWLALFVKVAIALAVPSVVNHNHFQVDHALKSFFFIPYFSSERTVVPLHGVGWTLLHELFFYLLFSLALLARVRPVLWVSVGIVALWLTGLVLQIDAAWWVVATHEANLQFVLGMGLATLLTSHRIQLSLRYTIATTFVLSAVVLCLPELADKVHFMYPILALFAAATLCLVHWKLPSGLHWAVRLGDSSYSLYLFHPFIAPAAVIAIARVWPGSGPWWNMGLALLFTIAASHALHLVVEVPIVRLARQRLLRTRADPRAAPGAIST